MRDPYKSSQRRGERRGERGQGRGERREGRREERRGESLAGVYVFLCALKPTGATTVRARICALATGRGDEKGLSQCFCMCLCLLCMCLSINEEVCFFLVEMFLYMLFVYVFVFRSCVVESIQPGAHGETQPPLRVFLSPTCFKNQLTYFLGEERGELVVSLIKACCRGRRLRAKRPPKSVRLTSWTKFVPMCLGNKHLLHE